MSKRMINLTINGTKYAVPNDKSTTPLIDYLRNDIHLTGTKVMCREGGCGACVVAVTRRNPVSGKLTTKSIASCLVQLFQLNGASITTIEKLGNNEDGYNDIQTRLSEFNGSQCGYCSPGMAMNLYCVLENNRRLTANQLEDSLDGNICRCTGYRTILDAMKSFASKQEAPDIEDAYRCSSCVDHFESAEDIDSQRPKVYRPDSLVKFYNLLAKLGKLKYQLILGGTGRSISKSDATYDALVDLQLVSELYQFSTLSKDDVIVGSNVSLNDLAELFRQVAERGSHFNYFREMSDFILTIGNKHIRNIAGWAGNLMIKHHDRKFSSDIFLLFEAVGAELTIGRYCGKIERVSPQKFLDIDMHGKLIEKVTIPIWGGNSTFRAYKVTPRALNSPCYISCAFKMDIDERGNHRVSTKPSIVYQGVSHTLTHAQNTERYLVGKELMGERVLSLVFRVLDAELIPEKDLPKLARDSRNLLGKSLFYRFLISATKDFLMPRILSGASPIPRGISRGEQGTNTSEENWPITQPVFKIESLKQVAGEIQYTGDLPFYINQLHAAFVISDVGPAKIKNIDASEALQMEGVVKFITAKDIPEGGKNTFTQGEVPSKQEEVLCSGQILFAGQAIGFIVAESHHIATKAAKQVKIEYEDIRKPIVSIAEAIKKNMFLDESSRQNHEKFSKLDEKKDELSVRGEINTAAQYHYFLENHSSLCIPTDAGYEIWSSSQAITKVQIVVGKVLGIADAKVLAKARQIGGAFGGKLSCSLQPAAACALASHICKCPVSVDVPLDVTMKMLGKRFPYLMYYSASFTPEGKLTGVYIAYYNDCGVLCKAYSVECALEIGENVYESPTWILHPIKVKTDLPPNTYFRAPGLVQGLLAIETIMEHIAHKLEMDPLELRIRNMAGIKSDLRSTYLGRIMSTAISDSKYYVRKQEIDDYNTANRWLKKGISFVPMKYPITFFMNKLNVRVCIYAKDGSVVVNHGGVEMGQGINTKVVQVCAATLGAPYDIIHVVNPDSVTCPNNQETGSSLTSDLCCFEAVKCCKILKERMKPVIESNKNMTWPQLVQECHNRTIDLCAQSTYSKEDVPIDYDIYATCVTEVEVDILTGQTVVRRVDLLYDCGKSISPSVDIGQIEGGFVQGMGQMLTEKLQYNQETGENITHSTWNYHPPSSKDIPVDFRIKLLDKVSNPFGVLSSKSTGEPSVCLASCVLLAVRSAVQAALAEISEDAWCMLDAPATPEEVISKCLLKEDQFELKYR